MVTDVYVFAPEERRPGRRQDHGVLAAHRLAGGVVTATGAGTGCNRWGCS